MPQLQVVDTTPNKPEPTGVQEFFSKLSKSYKDKSDRVEIDKILGEYEQNMGDSNAIRKLNMDLERSTINPSRRMEVQKSINEGERTIAAKDKALNDQVKALNAREKANNPKKTQASQPIDPDQLSRIQMVRNSPEYEKASPSKKYQLMTDNLVSKENAEAESKIFAEEEKNKPGGKFAEEREKAISAYTTTAFQKGEEAEDMKVTLDTARKAIKGDVAGPGFEAAAKNNPYLQLFTGLTKDEASLQAANKKLLAGSKGIFGSKPTEREIFLLLNSMLPSIGKSKEANEAGLAFIEKMNDLVLLHSDVVDEITDGGSKYVPDLESKVKQLMKPHAERFKSELQQAVEKQDKQKIQEELENKSSGKIKVKAPDGTFWNMTQKQIDAAKEKDVIFEPVKK